ncbi:hypothetical protein [Acidocella sp.]|uniref:hypothetical protein n=1 Tax=Acidocella sp. TaxID=50710 RepID=UPI002F3FCE0B
MSRGRRKLLQRSATMAATLGAIVAVPVSSDAAALTSPAAANQRPSVAGITIGMSVNNVLSVIHSDAADFPGAQIRTGQFLSAGGKVYVGYLNVNTQPVEGPAGGRRHRATLCSSHLTSRETR